MTLGFGIWSLQYMVGANGETLGRVQGETTFTSVPTYM